MLNWSTKSDNLPSGTWAEGVGVEFPNLKCLFMSYNIWKDMIVIHLQR